MSYPPAPESANACLSCKFSYGTASMVTEPLVSVPHSVAACCCSLVHGSPAQRDNTNLAPLNEPIGAPAGAAAELGALLEAALVGLLAAADVAGAAAVDDATVGAADDEVPALDGGAALFELDELQAASSTGVTHSVSAAKPWRLRRWAAECFRFGEVYMRAPCSRGVTLVSWSEQLLKLPQVGRTDIPPQ
jgi:hypothetical protein